MDYMVISRNVDKLIGQRGLSTATVERRADLGNGTIRSWRKGRNVKIDSLAKVAKVLDVTVDDLLMEG